MQSNKILAFLMAFAVLVSAFGVFGPAADASKEEETKVWMDEGVSVEAGEETVVNLNIAGNPGLAAFGLKLRYNPEELECLIDEVNFEENPNPMKQADGNPTAWSDFLDTLSNKNAYTVIQQGVVNSDDHVASVSYAISPKNANVPVALWNTDGVIASVRFKALENVGPVDSVIQIELDGATGEGNQDVAVTVENGSIHIGPEATTTPTPTKAVTSTPTPTEAPTDTTPTPTEAATPTDTMPTPVAPDTAPAGCYIATAVYGSYNTPQVWTLRRFRDNVLAKTWQGRLFIRAYYTVSPAVVELFGDTEWFNNLWRGQLDNFVAGLQAQGYASTPYQDIAW